MAIILHLLRLLCKVFRVNEKLSDVMEENRQMKVKLGDYETMRQEFDMVS